MRTAAQILQKKIQHEKCRTIWAAEPDEPDEPDTNNITAATGA